MSQAQYCSYSSSGAGTLTCDMDTNCDSAEATVITYTNGSRRYIVSYGSCTNGSTTVDYCCSLNQPVGAVNLLGTSQSDTLAFTDGSYDLSGVSGAPIKALMDGRGSGDDLDGSNEDDETLYAEELRGSGGEDTIHGNDGPDVIRGGDGVDDLFGDGGADRIYGDGAGDNIWGGAGPDTIYEGAGRGTVWGEGNDDVIYANSGGTALEGETIDGGPGFDQIHGGPGPDVLYGGTTIDADFIWGHGGDDTIEGGPGADDLFGGDGNDWIEGQGGFDQIWGEGDNDTLFGDDGQDELFGGDGDDILIGGEHDDDLWGGLGDDVLVGGFGSDLLCETESDTDGDPTTGGENMLIGGDCDPQILNGCQSPTANTGDSDEADLYNDTNLSSSPDQEGSNDVSTVSPGWDISEVYDNTPGGLNSGPNATCVIHRTNFP